MIELVLIEFFIINQNAGNLFTGLLNQGFSLI